MRASSTCKTATGAIVAQVTPDSPASERWVEERRRDRHVERTEDRERQRVAGCGERDQLRERRSSLVLCATEAQQTLEREGWRIPQGAPRSRAMAIRQVHRRASSDSRLRADSGCAAAAAYSVAGERCRGRRAFVRASPAEDAGLYSGRRDRRGRTASRLLRRSSSSTRSHANPAGKDLLLLVWSQGNASYRVVHTDGGNQNGE